MCHFYFESYIYKNKYWKYIHENKITSRFVEKFVTGHVNTSVKSWIIEEMEKTRLISILSELQSWTHIIKSFSQYAMTTGSTKLFYDSSQVQYIARFYDS